jgi:tripeptide aminopeptidase
MSKRIEHYHQRLEKDTLENLAEWVLAQGLTIQQIPAPTFDEAARARYVMEAFGKLKLVQIDQDEVCNVYGLMQGTNPNAPSLLVCAHTDTVFAAETDLSIKTNDNIISAPGIGDNSIGVASVLGLAHYLLEQDITPACNIWFVATSREEGLGDLGGIKAAFERLQPQLGAVINLEGVAFGHIYNAAIAVRRLRVIARAEGGHSWLHYGRASAIHTLVELGARITKIRPAQSPRTTYNIGVIKGGTTINAIATEAEFWLDMRSETTEGLEVLEAQIQTQIAAHAQAESVEIRIVGDRPSGYLASSHPLVQDALAALSILGTAGSLETGSTDANIPLSRGCPAVTIGITRGGNAHRLDEYIEVEPIAIGLQQLLILSLTTADRLAGVS